MLELALMFLKANWKWILPVLLLLGVITYTKTLKFERDHYKKDLDAVTLEYNNYKKQSKENQDLLKQGATEITAKYQNVLGDATKLTIENARLNAENIKNAKELRDVKLSLDAVRLFNASKSDDSSVAETKSGNDEAPTTTKETPTVNLQDLLLVVNDNDANHLACIKTVETWQNFWQDYVKKVEAVNARNN